MQDQNLKVAKYEPLTFACVWCDQQFQASGKTLQQISAEVADHIRQKHPELSAGELEKKAAA